MTIDYLEQFPIQAALLPARLRGLLETVGGAPRLRVKVARRYCADQHGPNREYLHMIMALVPEKELSQLGVLRSACDGLVSGSTPYVTKKGGLSEFTLSLSGHDYIVAAWGNGHFYSYYLAEKVWMALGLSPRCLGSEQQRVIFDDLALPELGVVEGEISSQYYFSPSRDICWTMSNEYLRRYLWMRSAYGVRVFFYEALLPDCPGLRKLMDGKSQVRVKPPGGWCEVDIREQEGGLLIQVWASVAAVSPEPCPKPSADDLVWPGIAGPMTHCRANSLTDFGSAYLDDRFLERYEQSGHFDTAPVKVDDNQWHCSPSYPGQWAFSDCVRVGRNAVRVPIRELYKPKPDREIIHANEHVLQPAQVGQPDQDEEHIVSKTERYVNQLLDLGDHLVALNSDLELKPKPANEIVGFARSELHYFGWSKYPRLLRLAQVAPLAMTEQLFLSRCKNIHEFWQHIPNGFLKNLLVKAGHDRSDIKTFRSLKLLQALLNIVERLNAENERVDAFGADPHPEDLTSENTSLTALFVNYDLRMADAHDTGDVHRRLEELGLDVAALNEGYGSALDQVFDGVINAFAHLNKELAELLSRQEMR